MIPVQPMTVQQVAYVEMPALILSKCEMITTSASN